MNQKQIDIYFPQFHPNFPDAPQTPTQWYRKIRRAMRRYARRVDPMTHGYPELYQANWDEYRAELFRCFYNGELD